MSLPRILFAAPPKSSALNAVAKEIMHRPEHIICTHGPAVDIHLFGELKQRICRRIKCSRGVRPISKVSWENPQMFIG